MNPKRTKLSKSAKVLLAEIKAGRNRVFYTHDQPAGWSQLEKQGIAYRKGNRAFLIVQKGSK